MTTYALDTELDLDENATKEDVLKAVQGYAFADAEIVGTFKPV